MGTWQKEGRGSLQRVAPCWGHSHPPPPRPHLPCPHMSSGPPPGGNTRSLSSRLLTSHEAPSFLQKQGD